MTEAFYGTHISTDSGSGGTKIKAIEAQPGEARHLLLSRITHQANDHSDRKNSTLQ